MINNTDMTGKVAFDANGLNNLKQAAKDNSPEAIKGVAKQFEAIFMNMMLKSMREATPQDSPFDSEQSRTFTSMLDQQLSSNLASKGLGLADILARQLSKNGYPVTNTLEQAVTDVQEHRNGNISNEIKGNTSLITNPLLHGSLINSSLINSSLANNPLSNNHINQLAPPALASELDTENNKTMTPKSSNDNVTDFQNRMAKHAEEASRATGIPAHLMLGQAALESGWGKREIKSADGKPSYNLFGIKATGNWDGKVAEATTTEYIQGIKQTRIEKFRAYDSYADSFKDFANMMRSNPRYEKVIANMGNINNYAQALQNAGYATDPNYATKLASVIKQIAPS